jgi:bacterioferritin
MPRNNSSNAAKRAAKGVSGSGGVARGDAKTLALLNQILKNELTAINQYFLHSRMLADWGVSEFAKYEYHESIDEMKHADRIIQRILFLGGLPNLQDLGKLMIGENVEEIIQCDLKLEEMGLPDLVTAIAHAEKVGDYGTRELYTDILESEEEHIDYLRTQQKLIAAIGIADFIHIQAEPNAASALKAPGD